MRNSLVSLRSNMAHVEVEVRRSGSTYKLNNIPGACWGKELRGLDIKQPLSQQEIERLKSDVNSHRLVVLRDQGLISGQRQVDVSRWFGDLESTFYKHPASPHPDVFRVSNDDTEGCTGVGRTGWHIDGSFQRAPFHYSTYHIVSVPREGATVFAPLSETLEALPAETAARWERLWKISDRRGGPMHPLIYSHPITGRKTMCFHTGMTAGFLWDFGSPLERVASKHEVISILEEIDYHFRHQIDHLIYKHHWKEGDFILSDNLAVAHEASPDTQKPRSEVGLRVMHRTTIAGVHVPKK